MKPSYSLNEFKRACKQENTEVNIMTGAKEAARIDFGLTSKEDILNVIGNNRLERPKFISTKKWENNPNPKKPVMVDSYGFYFGYLYGYIAFMFTRGGWIIKSFKKNTEIDVRYFPFRDSLKGMIH
ncbi:MAG: hypothetical protein PVI75_06495 [Gammaproteobacteria bacterium]|jgi:hypothetical protein